MLRGFRDFVMRGNVAELAVAIIIGGAFLVVVQSLIDNVINPLIANIFGEPDLSELRWGDVLIGEFLNDVIAFFLVALAVYFVVVIPFNKINELRGLTKTEAVPEDIQLLRDIRDALVRSERD